MKENMVSIHNIRKFVTEYEFDLPVKKVINLEVQHDGITVGINLTESEALEVIKKLAKHLDVKDVLTAVTKAVKAK